MVLKRVLVTSFFVKTFGSSKMEIVRNCQFYFGFNFSSEL